MLNTINTIQYGTDISLHRWTETLFPRTHTHMTHTRTLYGPAVGEDDVAVLDLLAGVLRDGRHRLADVVPDEALDPVYNKLFRLQNNRKQRFKEVTIKTFKFLLS